jgi:hypothetical protein
MLLPRPWMGHAEFVRLLIWEEGREREERLRSVRVSKGQDKHGGLVSVW